MFKTIVGTTALVVGVVASAQVASTVSSTSSAGDVVVAPSATATAATTAAETTAAVVKSKKAAKVEALPPLDLSDMKLWNWNGKWHASEWDNASSKIPWRYNHVTQKANDNVLLTLDATGAPELQAQKGIPANANGLWETEVTLPKLRDGVVVAPLWLYDQTSKDEIDFEFAGKKGLDVSVHTYVNGTHLTKTVRLFAGTDFSERRMRFGIYANQAAGTIDMYVDNELAYRFERTKLGYFPSKPMKPFIEMWASNPGNTGFVQWLGKWTGFAKGESMTMKVHGYGYKAL